MKHSPEGSELTPGDETRDLASQSPDLGEFRDQASALAARLEEARKRKEEGVEQKTDDLAALYGQGREINEQLVVAREIVQSYEEAMRCAGDVGIDISLEERHGHEEAKQLVMSLSGVMDKIVAQIDAFSRQPEVMEKVEGRAKKEYTQREVREIEQQTIEELLPEIDALSSLIRAMAGEYKKTKQEVDELANQASEVNDRQRDLVRKVYNLAPEVADDLEGFYDRGASEEEIRHFLEGKRESGGLFDGKKKKRNRAVDLILSDISLVGNEAREKYNSAHQHFIGKEWGPYREVISQFDGLISKVEKAEGEISQMLETEQHYPQRISDEIYGKLRVVLYEEGIVYSDNLKTHFNTRRFSS